MCCASPVIVAIIWSNVLLEIGNGGIFLRSAWIAKTLGVEFVDPKSWLDDWDFARDGLRINLRGTSRLSQLYYSRVGGLGSRGKKRDWYLMLNASNEGTSKRTRKTSTHENSTLTWKATERERDRGRDDEFGNEEVRICVKWGMRGLARVTTDRGKTASFATGKLQEYSQKILEFWNLIDIIRMWS